MSCRIRAAAAIAAFLAVSGAAQAQLPHPPDWTWRLDSPATLTSSQDMPERSWRFVMMPPGWHITTGPGALLYPSTLTEMDGRYSIEAQIFLFPGKSLGEYGVFIGGRGLEGEEPVDWTELVIRRDGHAAVVSRSGSGSRTVVARRAHEAVVLHTGGDDAVKNVVRVDVDPGTVTFSVNGVKVIEVPRSDVRTSGRIGLRVGSNLNLHVASVDVTRRLAPVPPRKQTP